MSTFAVILPAAGLSSRFANKLRKKPFIELQKRPIWLRSLDPFLNRDEVVQTIVVLSPDDIDWFKDKFRANLAFMDVELVAGGAERADSVEHGLRQVRDEIEFVAVHDAARPLLTTKSVDEVFTKAQQTDAAILATPIASTVKRVNEGTIQGTVSREGLWAAQTPQVFRRQLLLDAYADRGDFQPTDEAELVERTGHPVSIVEGSPLNMKITTQDDLRIAERLLGALPDKSGLKSLHPFPDEKPGLFS